MLTFNPSLRSSPVVVPMPGQTVVFAIPITVLNPARVRGPDFGLSGTTACT